jgi:D-arabinose 1-dehydrogenase-like Zn-dependent alcohol dehydrogenase
MSQMRRQSLVAYGAPLCETVVDYPHPTGTEVLVRIERCGVCHSDLHMQDGYFKLSGDKRLDVSRGRMLPEAQELMALARTGKVPPIPIRERPLAEAQAALDDIRAGRVVGRVALMA